MNGINWGRVVAGGLLAGVVIDVVESVASTFYMKDMQTLLAEHNLSFAMGPGAIAMYLGLGLMVGLVAVWLYAGVRARYGPGPGTAVRVAVAVWLVWYVTGIASMASFGLMPSGGAVASALAMGLGETLLGTLLGAWVYRE